MRTPLAPQSTDPCGGPSSFRERIARPLPSLAARLGSFVPVRTPGFGPVVADAWCASAGDEDVAAVGLGTAEAGDAVLGRAGVAADAGLDLDRDVATLGERDQPFLDCGGADGAVGGVGAGAKDLFGAALGGQM